MMAIDEIRDQINWVMRNAVRRLVAVVAILLNVPRNPESGMP
jgi:hypothetical protein